MCMEDIILGRKTYSTIRTVTTQNGASTPIAPASDKRIHIWFASSSAGIRVAPNDADANGFGAFTVGATLAPVEFDIKEAGAIVQTNWNGAGQGGAFNILVIETFLNQEQ